MKIFFITIVVFTISIYNINAQSWKFSSGGNAFDGKYKTAHVIGKGTDFPHHKPMLTINMFNEESLNFYIVDAGYFQSESEMEVLWIFNNKPEIIFTTVGLSLSEDGKIIFLNSFIDSDYNYYSRLEFIEKLKTANKVDVRIKNKYGKNDISFGLMGSTKAIDFAISKKYLAQLKKLDLLLDELKKEEEKEKERQIEEEENKQLLGVSNVIKLVERYNLSSEEEKNVIDEVKLITLKEDFNIYDIDSVDIEVAERATRFTLFNNHKELYKFLRFQSFIPKYVDKIKSERIAVEQKIKKENIQRILEIFKTKGVNSEELLTLSKLLARELSQVALFNLEAIKSFYIQLPTNSIAQTNIILNNEKGEFLAIIRDVDLDLPFYINDVKTKNKEECKLFTFKIIKQYGFSDKELNTINNNIESLKYFNFNPSLVIDSRVKFDEEDKSITIFKLVDKQGNQVHSFNVYDKSLTKRLKKRL